MKFQFYNELVMQPDVQEVVQDLLPPIKTLENLEDKLKNLPKDDLKSAAFAEVSSKVERLVNKHFPNLVHDYCKLSLEYRNTAIIKRENANGQVNEYTAKDILLKNLSKLIEEIHVAEHDFNDNYSHKLLVQNRVVNDLGVQKNLLEIQTETVKPVELKNKFDYKNFIKTNSSTVEVKKQENLAKPPVISPVKLTNEKTPESFFSKVLNATIPNIVVISLGLALLGSLGSVTYLFASSAQNQIDVGYTARHMMKLSSNIKSFYYSSYLNEPVSYADISIKKLMNTGVIMDYEITEGKYANKFDGEYIIKPYTIDTKNDRYMVVTTNLSKKTCASLVEQINPAFMQIIINNKVIRGDNTLIDKNNVASACSLEKNNVGFIEG